MSDLYDLWGSLKTIPEQTQPVIPPLPPTPHPRDDYWERVEQYQAEQIASAKSEADQEAIAKEYAR